MKNLIDHGEEWMEPLLELRQDLKDTQNPDKKLEVREMKRRDGQVALQTENDDKITPGPYKLEFCKSFLGKLLNTQKKVQKTGPDPNMTLISEDEIHEIQRIWRMERGDWKNSAYQIYKKTIGTDITPKYEDLGGFGGIEQEVLEEVCQKNEVPYVLVSKLLHAEFDSQGMTKHSKVYSQFNKILSEEWRENLDEIKKDLKKKRSIRKEYD